MRSAGWACACLVLLAPLRGALGHEGSVVPLNDANFEHATQAASGQTTGFWFVYFGRHDDAADQQMWRAFAESQREEQPWLLHAFVDTDANPVLAERFRVKSSHAFILFRNRKMYRFVPGDYVSRLEPSVIELLAAFSRDAWREAKAEQVPPDRHSRSPVSGLTLAVIVGGAAAAAVLLAVLGSRLRSYLEAATPVTARPKGQ